MIDDFDRDTTRFWFFERSRCIAVKRCPCIGVNLGFEGSFECLVGVIRAEEVGVTDEEAFFVVVGVDKPAGDALAPSERTSPVFGWKTSTPWIVTCV